MKQETQQQTASTTTSQKVVSQQAQKSSASAIDKLKEFGGFAFLENIIDGYSNLNPARKARRNIFLTDEQWENERKALVNRLSVWLKLLRETLPNKCGTRPKKPQKTPRTFLIIT